MKTVLIKYPLLAFSLAGLMFYNQYYSTFFEKVEQEKKHKVTHLHIMDFSHLRDTLYTFSQNFVEVNLATQKAYVHSRNEPTKEFGISSGTAKLFEGVDTNEGLFVVQAKLPKWHSVQFDSTLMLYWIGFNHGIGFHALEGNGYYRYLGKKKSSHGCVRVSREDAKELYKKITVGTPVLVHSGNNAVVVGFADSTEHLTEYSYTNLYNLLPGRYGKLYDGRYFAEPFTRLVINLNNIKHSGLPIGDSGKIPEKQLLLPGSLKLEYAIADVLKVAGERKVLFNLTKIHSIASSNT
jgi:hypothetical protein